MMDRKGALFFCAIVAFVAWVGAAISSLLQKLNVDKIIRTTDASAIQIQQLNGSATTHALVLFLFACAATIPLLIVAVSALVAALPHPDDVVEALDA